MFEFISQLWQLIYQMFLIPFQIFYNTLWFIYRTVFFLQINMCEMCKGIFGNGYASNIIDPAYVFTNVVFSTIKIVILVHIALRIREVYDKWKDLNSDNE